MDNPTRPIGTLESMATCAGVAALAGVGSAILLMLVWDWSILQGIFGGFVVAAVLMPVLMRTIGRPSTAETGTEGELETRDVLAEAAAKRANMVPRNVNAPSPHKESIDYSFISDPRTDQMETPQVNKALGGETATTRVAGGPAPTPAPALAQATPPGAKPSSAPAPKPSPAPAPSAETAAAPSTSASQASVSGASVSGTDVPEGQEKKPETLTAARDGKPDDLKKIKGVGPKLEKLCNELGFYHYDQISKWTAEEVAWVDQNLTGFKGRVSRDDWVSQARLLAAGGETEFSKKVDEGGVY